MKKQNAKKILLTLAVAALALPCAHAKKRAKTAEELPDSYGGQESTAIEVDGSKIEKNKDASSDPYNKAKMAGKDTRTGVQRAFNLNKFQKIESFSLYARNIVGKFTTRKAYLIHRAGTDVGGFACYYDTSAYAVQFASQARAALRAAIDKYFSDFDEKKLDKNAKKTNRAYGSCDAYEDFGSVMDMMQDYSRPKAHFGYLFVKDSPYFVIYIPRHENLKKTGNTEYDDIKKEVIGQTYYFTRAQAKRLQAFLADENISALKGGLDEGAFDEDEIRADAFDGADAAAGGEVGAEE